MPPLHYDFLTKFRGAKLTMEKVSKNKFKDTYFKYGKAEDGWGKKYWDNHYENPKNQEIKYFIQLPTNDQENRMMIVDGKNECRLFFLTVDREEAFFDYPGKE